MDTNTQAQLVQAQLQRIANEIISLQNWQMLVPWLAMALVIMIWWVVWANSTTYREFPLAALAFLTPLVIVSSVFLIGRFDFDIQQMGGIARMLEGRLRELSGVYGYESLRAMYAPIKPMYGFDIGSSLALLAGFVVSQYMLWKIALFNRPAWGSTWLAITTALLCLGVYGVAVAKDEAQPLRQPRMIVLPLPPTPTAPGPQR